VVTEPWWWMTAGRLGIGPANFVMSGTGSEVRQRAEHPELAA
jgi:hypothetical protein